MPYYKITGGKPLQGEVIVSGSKNAALPILAASLLTNEPVRLSNIPDISDIQNLFTCLSALGKSITKKADNTFKVYSSPCESPVIPTSSASKIRGSIILLGPLLARYEKVTLPLPGGCSIGKRPIDQHIKALEALGVEIIEHRDRVECTRKISRLQANIINFDLKTVTGTENAIMAATLAKGTSIINNATREPEIIDLIMFLNSMGADIQWLSIDTVKITGVEYLRGCDNYKIIGDRIEAGTYLAATAITQGSIVVRGIDPSFLESCFEVLKTVGAEIECEKAAIYLKITNGLKKPFQISTQPYPGFPTDLQSIFLCLATQLDGVSTISETVFENRFQIAKELTKMDAVIPVDKNVARIIGKTVLNAHIVRATDLRAGAALVCAALAAQGTSFILEADHILRGYERFDVKLRQLGACIELIDAPEPKFIVDSSVNFFSSTKRMPIESDLALICQRPC